MARRIGSSTQKILEFIKMNPRANNREVLKFLGIASPEYVRSKMRQLRAAGYLHKSTTGYEVFFPEERELPPRKSSSPETPQTSELPEILAAMNLDGAGRRVRMQQLALTGSDNVAIAALTKLEEWEKSTGGGVGPRPPRTPEERIFRLSRLMVGVGRKEAEAAWKVAEEEWTKEAAYKVVITGGTHEAETISRNSPSHSDMD